MRSGFTQLIKRIAQRKAMLSLVIIILTFSTVTIALLGVATSLRPMSVVDEHVHYDYALRLQDGDIPSRGSVYTPDLVAEWACGVSSEGGALPYLCGDPNISADILPSGRYTTGYIHYPTYFLGAVLFRQVTELISTDIAPLSAYRLFSALVMLAGIGATFVVAWKLTLRGSALIAATFLPVGASLILVAGTIVNPGSTAIITGSLIAGTGIRWMLRGSGFGWLLAAALLASVTAVTDSLPTGAFILAVIFGYTAQRLGYMSDSPWRPRIIHVFLLAASVLIPIIGWGVYISATASVPNSALYDFAQVAGPRSVVVGAATEAFALHTPWVDSAQLLAVDATPWGAAALRGAAGGLAVWSTVFVFGALAFVTLRAVINEFRSERATGDADASLATRGSLSLEPARPAASAFSALTILAACTLVTIIAYPPALRISNSLTFGFDYGITYRYSAAFAPLLVLLVLLLVRKGAYTWILAAIGLITALGLSLASP